MAVGTWLPGTGFTRVLEQIARALAADYDVHVLGIGYRGPERALAGATLHPTNLHGGDVFAAFAAAELAARLPARAVLVLGDLWMLPIYMRTLPPTGARILAHVPLDGRIVSDAVMEPLAAVDRFIATTEFGRRELAASLQRLGRAQELSVIGHGVDGFRPLPGGRREARRRLFADDVQWRDAFVVLNANRPHERKRIDLTIEGFARFAQDKPPGVKLWLHHAHMDADQRGQIVAHAAEHGVSDRLRLSELSAPPLSDDELATVYTACEVGLNTAMGEGWGLISFEHAATGAAQVVPDSSACSELWQGAAELVPTEDAGVPPFSRLAMRTVTARGVAEALERLYRDPAHLHERSEAAYRNATRPRYRPQAVAGQWRSLFAEMVGR